MQSKGLFIRVALFAVVMSCVAAASAQDPAGVSETLLPAKHEPITPIPSPPAADPGKIALGKRLFEDPGLSRSGTLSCLSCHDIRTSGANSHRIGPGSHGGASFNAPTVFNAALNFRLNWQGNVQSLEEQAEQALSDQRSMGQNIDKDVLILSKDHDLAGQFYNVYGHRPDRDSLLNAIATFERSLLTPDSPFDRWLRGDSGALSAQAVAGYHLFKSFGCVSCHQGVNVGGNLLEESGIFHHLASSRPQMFRVPSLRNVAVTAPYFHDGSAATLQDAVRKMGYAQLDRKLSDGQVEEIDAFLDSLTGLYHGKPLTPPP